MTILRILFLLPLAFAFAIPAAAMFLFVAGLMEPAGRDLALALVDALAQLVADAIWLDAVPDVALPVAWSLWRASLAVLVAPVLCAGLAGEIFRVRSYVYYAGVTGLVTALVPWVARTRLGIGSGAGLRGMDPAELRLTAILFVTGVVAGTIYWLIAGRTAGPRVERSADTPVH